MGVTEVRLAARRGQKYLTLCCALSEMGAFLARFRRDAGDTQARGQQPSRINEQDKAVLVSFGSCVSRST